MKTFTAQTLDQGTVTFYVEDCNGELVGYLGHLRSLPDVSSLRHIGSVEGAAELRANPPKYVVIEGRKREVMNFIPRCVDDRERPRMVIEGGYRKDTTSTFETVRVIDAPSFAVNVVRAKRSGGVHDDNGATKE